MNIYVLESLCSRMNPCSISVVLNSVFYKLPSSRENNERTTILKHSKALRRIDEILQNVLVKLLLLFDLELRIKSTQW